MIPEFKQDVQIRELPLCGNPNCDNKGFVWCVGRWMCGECVVKVSDMKNKMVFESLVEATKK